MAVASSRPTSTIVSTASFLILFSQVHLVPRVMTSRSSSSTASQIIGQFVKSLAAKQPTPGGGAAAAVGASVGAAAAAMAANYTQRKKDIESGAAARAQQLIETLKDPVDLLQVADEDAEAYANLQRTWKESGSMTVDEKAAIEARALAVPTNLVMECHACIVAINEFLPHCNPNIISDAKVGIHQLAGSARAAYQTVLVNSPSQSEKERLVAMLHDIKVIEDKLL